ncbi:UNVERIFIED_CONTAM: hypothetical protein Scaly_0267400 [Sesamum calycinum]|uniref:Uncharacterized protein n=1 Tax=Sesamum calycinum TaxID=2727403 RepID=A0AAW2SBL7_9LAMI
MSQLASSVSKLESQGKLPSQTIVNPKQNASVIVLRSGKELQENTKENGTKRRHAQKRKPKKEVEIPQDQDDEAKKDNPKVLVTRPLPGKKFPAINDKDYMKFALEESPTPMEEGNMGVDPLVQVNAKFDGDSVFLAKINKDLTYGPRTYKNKAFHDKISSSKNSLMNIKVFIGPRHLRKHYIRRSGLRMPNLFKLRHNV